MKNFVTTPIIYSLQALSYWKIDRTTNKTIYYSLFTHWRYKKKKNMHYSPTSHCFLFLSRINPSKTTSRQYTHTHTHFPLTPMKCFLCISPF